MNKKKFLIFIVEGPSDRNYLECLKKYVYDKYGDSIEFKIIHTDLLTKYSKKDILHRVADCVREKKVEAKILDNEEIIAVIHITDADGIYICEESIIEDLDLNEHQTIYCRNAIKTLKKENIVSRNSMKSSRVTRLLSRKTLMGIPYRLYYFATNMDDFFIGNQNLSYDEKEDSSYEIKRKYETCLDDYIKLFYEKKDIIGSSYIDSWNYIKQGYNSLCKCTNFYLFIDEFLS